MKVVLPWGCIVSKNRKYTVTKSGRMILTKNYRDAKEAIKLFGKKAYKGKPLTGDVSMDFVLYLPDKRKRDMLNTTQIICDGLEGIFYEDDHQISLVTINRLDVDRDNPRVEVTVNAR